MLTKDNIAALSLPTLRKMSASLVDIYAADTGALKEEIIALKTDQLELAHEIDTLKKKLYAPTSEKRKKTYVDPNQQTLFGTDVIVDETPAESEDVIEADGVEEDAADSEEEAAPADKKTKKSHGRLKLSKDIPEEIMTLRASDSERIDCDGNPLVSGGFERSEILHCIPRKLIRLIIEREILVCAKSRETALVVPHEPRIVSRGQLSNGFIHECVLNKYLLGLPLYRQIADFKRYGVKVAASTLNDNICAFANLYEGVYAAIGDAVFSTSSGFIHADETRIRQMRNKGRVREKDDEKLPPSIRTAYFWEFLADKNVYFHYGVTRSSNEIRHVLGIPIDPEGNRGEQLLHDQNIDNWERGATVGFYICDAYASYDMMFKHESPTGPQRVGCWAHVRRKFIDRMDIDPNMVGLVERIAELFGIEKANRKHCEKKKLNAADIKAYTHEQRQEHSLPKLKALKERLEYFLSMYERTRPDGKTAGAIRYCLNQWTELNVYADHGQLPMDNNAAERAIRPITVGRKNYLFVGSEDGGKWAAICYSIIESCRMMKINPHDYIEHVTPILLRNKDPLHETVDLAALIPSALRDILRKK